MTAVFEKELRSYLNSLSGYVFGGFLLLFAGIYTMVINLNSGYASFDLVLQNMSFIFLVSIPILTMRVVAEERRQKTDQLLYALPLGMTRVMLGKYLAMLVIIAMPVSVMCLYPLFLGVYGNVALGASYSAILGFFLLAATLGAIGLLLSSLTDNQAVAAGLCFIVMLLLYFLSGLSQYVPGSAGASLAAFMVAVLVIAALVRFITKNTTAAVVFGLIGELGLVAAYIFWSKQFEGLFAKVMNSLSVFERFYTFSDGVFDVTAIVYFLTVIGVSLFLAIQSMEKRRWS